MKRDELLTRLERLLPAQFEEVLFHLRIPPSQFSGASAPQLTRAIEVLRHLENIGEHLRLERLLSSDGAAGVSMPSGQASAAAPPAPAYADAEVEALSKRLQDAGARRDKLRDEGIATDQVDHEILELRRHLREGGQLRAGDALSDGRYLLVTIVGRGGFAVVWEAYDRTEEQRVAIKVLHASLASDPQRRERFFRGAQAMAKLLHPAIVRVLDPQCDDGGFYYFVMEFVRGGNLREAVLAQRVKRNDVLPLILHVGEALALAHSRGMIHRDVKPANILLDEQGNAKLTDFDLVGAQDTTGGTRTGALGTVVYAAPECLEKPQEATVRADVYGLGMTAIFCLAGRELSMDTFRDAERTIGKLDCLRAVRRVLERSVQWKPDDRFPNTSAMLDALRAALNPAMQTANHSARRWPWSRHAIGSTLLAAAAAAVIYFVLHGSSHSPVLEVKLGDRIKLLGEDIQAPAGQVAHIRLSGGERSALWIYRGEQSVGRCPGDQACQVYDDSIAVDLALRKTGRYSVVALTSVAAQLQSAGTWDADIAAAVAAGAHVQQRQVLDVQ